MGRIAKSKPGYTPRKAPRSPPPNAAETRQAKMNMDTREVLMPTPRAIWASSTVARTIAHARFLHRDPQMRPRDRHADHEYTVPRSADADHGAFPQQGGRGDVQIIAAPDVERRLLNR